MTGKITLIPIPAGESGTPPDYGQAALELFELGFQPLPIGPGTKIPAVKWGNGKFEMTARNIRRHWRRHPDHELAVVLGEDMIVIDSDSTEGVIAMYMLWQSLDITPNLIVETTRGEHHYFRLSKGTFAKSDAPDKSEHPERVDIKTGNAIAIVPPSKGKSYGINEIESIDDLVEIGQEIVDIVFRHNGRDAPRKPPDVPVPRLPAPVDHNQLILDIYHHLQYIDADIGYEDWVRTGMAIHFETQGSDAGFELFDAWSSEGTTYCGHAKLLKKWRSFDGYQGAPVTLGTLRKIAKDSGVDLKPQGKEFLTDKTGKERPLPEHSLSVFSLLGMSAQFDAELLELRFVLPGIAIQGQWTVIYAPPNSGKTLLVLWLIIRGIINGDICPDDLYYINADDNHHGLTTKLKLAETHGFHMVAPGYKDFRVKNFPALLGQLSASGRAHGTILIIDTLKKFANLMDKRTASEFGNITREYIAKGGTMVALAHVNKHRDVDGKAVYAGTSDIVDDSDCAFVLDILTDDDDLRTVQFENKKSRGMVVKQAVYQYSTADGLGYLDLLNSVAPVDDDMADTLRTGVARANKQDLELILAVADCIRDGITAKTKLIAEVTKNTGSSRRPVEQVIDRFTGTDPAEHHWTYKRGARGLRTYELLPDPLVGDIVDLDGTVSLPPGESDTDLDDEETY